MKVLKGTAARINGKLYPEGSSIPQAYEKEFKDFLVDIKDTKSVDSKKSKKDSKSDK